MSGLMTGNSTFDPAFIGVFSCPFVVEKIGSVFLLFLVVVLGFFRDFEDEDDEKDCGQ